MSDRCNYLTIVLEQDLRDDDAEHLISAIKQLRGVLSVTSNVVDPDAFVAEERARTKIIKQFREILESK